LTEEGGLSSSSRELLVVLLFSMFSPSLAPGEVLHLHPPQVRCGLG